jgi:hypothetical protein
MASAFGLDSALVDIIGTDGLDEKMCRDVPLDNKTVQVLDL